MNTPLIVLGCGFVGTRAASFAIAAHQPVIGTTRDAARAAQLRTLGVQCELADTIDPHWLSRAMPKGCHVLVTYPPAAELDAALSDVARERDARVVYISSTAVYGAVKGRVDEHTPTHPNEARGERRLQAEEQWCAATRCVVLRAPAIYGPGRGLHLRIARGEHQLPDGGDNYISRIHADDLAHLCLAAFERGTPGARYVVGDHRPCPQREITQWLCTQLKQPMATPAALADVSPTLRNDRQVDPTHALQALGVTLEYPSYVEGYAHCLRQDGLLPR